MGEEPGQGSLELGRSRGPGEVSEEPVDWWGSRHPLSSAAGWSLSRDGSGGHRATAVLVSQADEGIGARAH